MRYFRQQLRLAPGLILALLLVGAQSAALAHAYEHDLGTAQNQACATCVTASQLSAASVDHSAPADSFFGRSSFNGTFAESFASIHTLTVRQRGPPASL